MTSRRDFFQKLLIIPGIIPLVHFINSCTGKSDKKDIQGKIIGASASKGHLLRDKNLSKPDAIIKEEIIIVGSGIAGLSAARNLINNNITDFSILELEKEPGGNSLNGENEIGTYPWGAHYLPLPDTENIEIINFLKECNVITHFDDKGLPHFNEYFLCHDPEERLYINGQWQNGLIPHLGINKKDSDEIKKFLMEMGYYKTLKGNDGKYMFVIPVDLSSRDSSLHHLDLISMHDFLIRNNYHSPFLHWYVNYTCRDDYGTDYKNTSAWAGIHYFASRRGVASNAESSAVLTWPEGNGFLAKKLRTKFENKIKSNCLVYSVSPNDNGVFIDYLDTESGKLIRIESKKCIVATPQFINKRIVKNIPSRKEEDYNQFSYAPWMVANLSLSSKFERSGRPLSWDNVIYNSQSLGYINSKHQSIHRKIEKKVFTYYYPLTEQEPAEERMQAIKKTHPEWCETIINELKKVYPELRESVENIDIWVWGHGMIRPTKGFITGNSRKLMQESYDNKIFFAHSDLSGVSIFEEAFYQGLRASKELLKSV